MKRSLIWKHPNPIFSIASSRVYPVEEEEEEEEPSVEGGVLVETCGEGGEPAAERDEGGGEPEGGSSMSESWEKPPSAMLLMSRSAREIGRVKEENLCRSRARLATNYSFVFSLDFS
jgi:hypothetical protein